MYLNALLFVILCLPTLRPMCRLGINAVYSDCSWYKIYFLWSRARIECPNKENYFYLSLICIRSGFLLDFYDSTHLPLEVPFSWKKSTWRYIEVKILKKIEVLLRKHIGNLLGFLISLLDSGSTCNVTLKIVFFLCGRLWAWEFYILSPRLRPTKSLLSS